MLSTKAGRAAYATPSVTPYDSRSSMNSMAPGTAPKLMTSASESSSLPSGPDTRSARATMPSA